MKQYGIPTLHGLTGFLLNFSRVARSPVSLCPLRPSVGMCTLLSSVQAGMILHPPLCSLVILFCAAKTWMVHFPCSLLVIYPNRRGTQAASFLDHLEVLPKCVLLPLLLLWCLFLPHWQWSELTWAAGFHKALYVEKTPSPHTCTSPLRPDQTETQGKLKQTGPHPIFESF